MIEAIHIESADVKDAQLLSRLSIDTFIETYQGTCSDKDIAVYTATFFSEKVIASELQQDDNLYFIAFTGKVPAGYIKLKSHAPHPVSLKNTALEIQRMYVLKLFQNKKIGKTLMDYVLRFAKKNNYGTIILDVWEENSKAKLFYTSFGFSDTGITRKFYIGDTGQTDHVLQKFIAEAHIRDTSL